MEQVHGVVALSTGGGDLHLAPGEDTAKKGFTILDMLMQSFQQWNVSHEVHKLRFGPEHPDAVYQLDGRQNVIEDTYGMYQYYFQVSNVSLSLISFLNFKSLSHISRSYRQSTSL